MSSATPSPVADVDRRRLRLAQEHGFTAAGSGSKRREAIAGHNRAWLRAAWAAAANGLPEQGIALAAVGSTGRGDAGPRSDYDLVVVHAERILRKDDVAALTDRLFYPFWDAGLRLDHSVRSVAQCRAVAREDLAVAVGLLDLEPIAGDADLVRQVREQADADWRGTARARLPEIVESVHARHVRHGELAQSLEPDLKESHGGLRDAVLVRALARSWLADRPHGGFDAASDRLLDVRDALQVVTGRGRDRLTREDHDAVASLLGLTDADDLLTEVSLAGRVIAHATDATLRRAAQAQRSRRLPLRPRRPDLTPLGHGVLASDGEVVLASADLADHPLTVLRVAVAAARSGMPVAPVTVDNLASRAPALPTPWSVEARDLFADLLAAGPGLPVIWEAYDQAGIIECWLPEWRAVRSRPQRNAVHRHTVDRHLIETVVRAQALVRQVARPDLLLLAALLHDLGKVKGARDHSATGAAIVAGVAQRLGLDHADAAIVTTLVREHLTLMDLATRRDHADPATVEAAAAAVGGSPDTLDLLLALTEADAAAAGPKAWTDWRASLLAQLGATVRSHLGGRATVYPAGRATAHLTPDRSLVQVPAVPPGEVEVRVTALGTSFRVDVATADRLGLFADTAGLLAATGYAVRTAILRTIDGIAVNEWYVDSTTDEAPDAERLIRGLRRLALGDRSPLAGLRTRATHPAAYPAAATTSAGLPGQTHAFLVPGASTDATVIEVRAADRRGMLHEVGRALADAGVGVRSAHISTYAGQTLDTFYLTDPDGGLLAPGTVGRLISLVIDACDGVTGAGPGGGRAAYPADPVN